MKIYLDTNVFISLLNEEIGFNFRGLNIEARDFFEKIKFKHTICISKLFLEETQKILFINFDQIYKELNKRNIRFKEVGHAKQETLTKFASLKIHYPDFIHAAIAFENCDCIVTFNLKDFEKAKPFILILSPTDF
ncbi:MAG: type II toxin-antitoxin system VapC family toxin [Candidatus ainarchaeum sp.]|nr:type II toxin-antitoxin system VapC family toxin [Candidatus ainarchaeum sp.]